MTEKRQKTLKKILTVLFVLFTAGVILWTALSEFNSDDNRAALSEVTINWRYLIPAALCWIVAMAAEVTKYAVLMKKTCGRVDWKISAETVLLGRYYDNITPFGAGGQPFQIYYMAKKGVPSAGSAAIPLIGFTSMQFAFIILALVAFISYGWKMQINLIKITSIVGLAFYSFVPVVILLFTFFESWMDKLMHGVAVLLFKVKLIHDTEETYLKWKKNVSSYAVVTKQTITDVPLCIVIMLLALVYQGGICSLPYFIVTAFGGNMDFIYCFVTTLSIYSTITFIPTPGNAGAAEGSFYAIFSVLTTGYTFWAMMTWRFFVFYLYIILGLWINLKHVIRADIRKKFTGKS